MVGAGWGLSVQSRFFFAVGKRKGSSDALRLNSISIKKNDISPYSMTDSAKQHIIQWACRDANYDDRMAVLTILNRFDNITIIEHADGCRINLDKLTKEQISQITAYIDGIRASSKDTI